MSGAPATARRGGAGLASRRPASAWRAAWDAAISDRVTLVSAGCAFYAMLALFPALSLLLSIYGLWFDLASVEPQIALLERLLPPEGHALIAARVREIVAAPRPAPGIGVPIGAAIALWSASAGIRALLRALNLAHGEPESRGTLAFYGTALLLTLSALVAVALALGLLVALPALLDALGVAAGRAALLRLASLALLLVLVHLAIAMLYRFGPARPPRGWRLFSRGAALATLLWAAASFAFSLFVGRFAAYGASHGALGAAVALLTWLWVSVYVVLLGAELDAAEQRRRPVS